MKFKKIVSLILCAVMALSLLAGCKGEDEESGENSLSGHNFELAEKYLESDEVVLRVNGEDMTWHEYLKWLRYAIYAFEAQYGPVTEWTKEDEALGCTYEEYILDYVDYMIYQYKSIEIFAPQYGGSLTDEDKEAIEAEYDNFITQYGGEEEFMKFIETSFGDKEFYDYLVDLSYMYDRCFKEQYGEKGEKLSDEEVLEYTKDDGYMMAKHILFLTVDMATNEPLPDDEIEAKKEKAEEVLGDIRAYEGDDIEGYFTELMNENSEDTGLLAYPDGYLFQPGEMVQEFENAVLSQNEYEVSDIVESDYGYHIIMTLPIDVDAVPNSAAMYGEISTLRYMTAWNMYYATTNSWIEGTNIEKTDEFDRIKIWEALGE